MANRINRKWRKAAEESERQLGELKLKLHDANNKIVVVSNERYDTGYFRAVDDIKKVLSDYATILPPEPESLVQKCLALVSSTICGE